MIPRILHQIWIGPDQAPEAAMATWPAAHPGWTYRRWTNADLDAHPWRAKAQMDAFASRGCWEGVADIMRYEILYDDGGIYLDADLTCVRPLDDWLLDCRFVAVYESERHRPSAVANGILGAPAEHAILAWMVARVLEVTPAKLADPKTWAFQTVGPVLLTEILGRAPSAMSILPSVLFLPQHYEDETERVSSLIYARHAWTGTQRHYRNRGDVAPCARRAAEVAHV